MSWPLALDAQMDTHRHYTSDIGRRISFFFLRSEFPSLADNPNLDMAIAGTQQVMVESLWRGDCIYVTRDMHTLLTHAADSYDGPMYLEPESFLTNNGWMLLEEPIIGEDVEGRATVVGALSWIRDARFPNVMHIFLYTDTTDPRDVTSREIIAHKSEPGHFYSEMKKTYPPGPPYTRYELMHYLPFAWPSGGDEDTNHFIYTEENFKDPGAYLAGSVLRYWIAFNLLAQQTIGVAEKMAPPRAVKKRARRWSEGPDRYITLITLRKKKAKHNDEPKKVDWSHQWVVTGHWRKQWYPSEGVHRYKYIADYVKGPENKPLVFRERRVFNLAR